MGKMAVSLVMVCVIVADPVLGGHWKYKGTAQYWPSGPRQGGDGQTWHYDWFADCSVQAWPGYLDISGYAQGRAWVALESDRNDARSAYVASGVAATSQYQWEPNGPNDPPTEIDVEISIGIVDANLAYYGHCRDASGSMIAYCESDANPYGDGGEVHLGIDGASGYGWGEADTGWGAYASNSCSHMPYKNTCDYDGWGGWGGWGWYQGSLGFGCQAHSYYPSGPNPPFNWLSVPCSLRATANAEGHIDRGRTWGTYWGGFDAKASYWILGESRINLYGNIQ